MTREDLTPKAVDQHPQRDTFPDAGMVVFAYRAGHFFDPYNTLAVYGTPAVDSQGVEWDIKEDRQGVYKCNPRHQEPTE